MTRDTTQFDPALDLAFERIVDVSPSLVWAAWTTPEHLVKWFTPEPWQTIACEIDLRPGGLFSTVMRSPEGQEFPGTGCYLEIIPNRKLVWTNALAPGYRPAMPSNGKPCDSFLFTAVVSIEAHGTGSKYSATVIHGNEEDRKKHEDMGFQEGWGKALDQLVACMKTR
ncbi:MAG: SRPBCC family protein [Arenimonas sp.]